MRPLALATLLLAASCGGADRPRSAVLVTLDTTRRDALSCFGGPAGITPNLDALAAEAVIYLEARTVAPLTLPAHASMLTGLYPPRHTVRDNALTPLPENASTLAERARDHGLATAAVVAALVLNRSYGLDQGFETYDEPLRKSLVGGGFHERSAEEVTARAVAWLSQRDPDTPYFLWVHYFDPHRPYAPGARFLEQADGNDYLASVARMDASVGELMKTLRAQPDFDKTIVVVVADHGEGLGEHGEDSHSAFVYDSTIRVPFFVRHHDGRGAGERSHEIVSVADVFPTLIDALELGGAGDVDGISLFRRQVGAQRGVYFESYYGTLYHGWSALAGWADAGGKYVHSSAPEFFDTDVDPTETSNLIDARAADIPAYRRALGLLAQREALEPAAAIADRALVLELQQLGYAGSGGAGQLRDALDAGDGPSPHASREELRLIFYSWNYASSGQHDEAARLLEQVLRRNPGNHDALARLGQYRMSAGRFGDALEPLQRFAEVGPPWPEPYRNLGVCYDELGRDDEALPWYLRALELDPSDVMAVERTIPLLQAAGREREADEMLRHWEVLRR